MNRPFGDTCRLNLTRRIMGEFCKLRPFLGELQATRGFRVLDFIVS